MHGGSGNERREWREWGEEEVGEMDGRSDGWTDKEEAEGAEVLNRSSGTHLSQLLTLCDRFHFLCLSASNAHTEQIETRLSAVRYMQPQTRQRERNRTVVLQFSRVTNTPACI